jgi:hypothetical protein
MDGRLEESRPMRHFGLRDDRGDRSISASADGRRAAIFEPIFKMLASDHGNEYTMILACHHTLWVVNFR